VRETWGGWWCDVPACYTQEELAIFRNDSEEEEEEEEKLPPQVTEPNKYARVEDAVGGRRGRTAENVKPKEEVGDKEDVGAKEKRLRAMLLAKTGIGKAPSNAGRAPSNTGGKVSTTGSAGGRVSVDSKGAGAERERDGRAREKMERDVKEREAKERQKKEMETKEREAKERQTMETEKRTKERQAKEKEANERQTKERQSTQGKAKLSAHALQKPPPKSSHNDSASAMEAQTLSHIPKEKEIDAKQISKIVNQPDSARESECVSAQNEVRSEDLEELELLRVEVVELREANAALLEDVAALRQQNDMLWYTLLYACLCIDVCVCIHICICIYIYIYTYI